MNNKRSLLVLFCLTLLTMPGCQLFDDARYDTVTVSKDKLHRVQPITLDKISDPNAPTTTNSPLDPNATSDNKKPAAPENLELTIEQCRALALETNLDMKIQLFDPQIAQQNVNIARAAFEPLFFSRFDFVKSDQPFLSSFNNDPLGVQAKSVGTDAGVTLPLQTGGSITVDQPFSWSQTNRNDYDYTKLNSSYTADMVMSISQPLLRGAGVKTNTSAIRIARYNHTIAETQTRLEIIRVLAAVDRNYWRLYAYRLALDVAKQQYDLARKQLDQARRMVDAGQSAPIEILRAESALAERVNSVITAENEVRQRQRELLYIINRHNNDTNSFPNVICLTPPNIAPYNIDPKKALDYALEHRMELLQLELQLAIDADRIDFERNGTLPYLACSYTYNINGLGPTSGDAYDLMAQNRFTDHRVQMQLQIPLGNQKALSSLRRAILEKQQRLATKDLQHITVVQETLAAIDQFNAKYLSVGATQKSALLAGKTFEAEQRQFAQGLQTSNDVLNAMTTFAQQQSAHIAAVAEYQIAQVDLAYAIGALIGAAQIDWADNTITAK